MQLPELQQGNDAEAPGYIPRQTGPKRATGSPKPGATREVPVPVEVQGNALQVPRVSLRDLQQEEDDRPLREA